MKIIKALFLIIIFSTLLYSQSDEWIVKSERENFKRSFELSKIQYPGDSSFDVNYYKLNLNITYNPNYLTGLVEVKAKPISSINKLFLDLQNSLNVDSVVSNGMKLSFTHTNAKLNVTLDKIYNIGDEINLIVYYQGVPGSSGFGSFEFGTHGNNEPAIWTLSEPYGASDWWPCKDTPADKADSSDVWITCDKSLIPVSNGVLIDTINNGNTHTYKWKNRHPIAQYLISLAISNYTVYKQYFHYSQNDSMPVIHYIYPETFLNVKPELDKTTTMLQIFSDRFGPYPFLDEKYGHAQFGWGGGMEHQTISSMGAFGESIISHELAHQWFGDKITCRDWNNIWLNEGFAEYSEGIFFEAFHGKSSYNKFINIEMDNAKNAVGTIYVQNINSINEIFDGSRTYSKGAIVLHMLRGIVGDSTFFRILKTYANDPNLAYGTAVTEDFQRVAENVSGLDLNYFFQEWIFGENYPKYNVSWNSNLISGGDHQVTININQQTNSKPTFFTMPVQLKITTNLGDTLITVFNDQQKQQFVLDIKGNPVSINFDPNNLILKDDSIVTSIKNNNIPKAFSLEQNYPNPFSAKGGSASGGNPTTTIRYSIPQTDSPLLGGAGGLVTLKVYDILGNEVTTLVNKQQSAGRYEVKFDASNFASGMYIYRLVSGDFVSVKKMILLK